MVRAVMMKLMRWDDRRGVMNQAEADHHVADEQTKWVMKLVPELRCCTAKKRSLIYKEERVDGRARRRRDKRWGSSITWSSEGQQITQVGRLSDMEKFEGERILRYRTFSNKLYKFIRIHYTVVFLQISAFATVHMCTGNQAARWHAELILQWHVHYVPSFAAIHVVWTLDSGGVLCRSSSPTRHATRAISRGTDERQRPTAGIRSRSNCQLLSDVRL